MENVIITEERRLIWIALSEFYLDTELQKMDIVSIAHVFIESPFSLYEVKQINKYEVFPVLQENLLAITGVWTGFNEEWLIESIENSIGKRKALKNILIDGAYFLFKSMTQDYWLQVEKEYSVIKNAN